MEKRDFDSISPSARWILMMKGHTDIPYAREAAKLIDPSIDLEADFGENNMAFWGRTLHFEMRYKGIDLLLNQLKISNILELSSGYSFRGLDMVMNKAVHYIDTDLPAMVEKKKALVGQLSNANGLKGNLELLPLNAMDEAAFNQLVDRFPAGELAIINEGLLMYLNMNEKEKLCSIIRNVLKKRGGYWITGDIYLKMAPNNIDIGLDDRMKKFFEEQNIEQNRFSSFEEAEDLFKRSGLIVDKEVEIPMNIISSFPNVMKYATQQAINKFKSVGKIHATWRLKPA
jgi:O-methyltransferase involved in polyketide biosynthesis